MTSEHAQGGQGDFGMNVKGGNRYGMDSSGDGIVTADELQVHYDHLKAAEAERVAADAAIANRLKAVQDKMDAASEAAFLNNKERGTHMDKVRDLGRCRKPLTHQREGIYAHARARGSRSRSGQPA